MEWDEEKNNANRIKHGISFEEAQEVFNDPNAIEFYDKLHSTEEEDRYVCIGDIGNYLLIVVIFTDRNGTTRINSARKAEPEEEVIYYEYLKKTLGRN